MGSGRAGPSRCARPRPRRWTNRLAVYRGKGETPRPKRAKAPTFRQAMAKTREGLRAGWTAIHAEQWARSLEVYAFPILGARRVDTIRGDDVLRVLTPIWNTKRETASRVRSRIKAVLSWAQAHGHADGNAAGDAIDGALPKNGRKKQHYRALPYAEVGAALAKVDGIPH